MTPEHQHLLAGLAQVGRLGAFCVWPNPETFEAKPDVNVVRPVLRGGDGGQLRALMTQGIRYANPGWLAEAWEALAAGPPNRGCTAGLPWCPKGWCTGQGDCPWSRAQLGNIKAQMDRELDGSGRHWYIAACQDCDPILPQPFLTGSDRDRWADQHRSIGHRVDTYEEEG